MRGRGKAVHVGAQFGQEGRTGQAEHPAARPARSQAVAHPAERTTPLRLARFGPSGRSWARLRVRAPGTARLLAPAPVHRPRAGAWGPERSWVERQCAFPAQTERLTTRDEDGQPWRFCQQRGDVSCRGQNLLEVIENYRDRRPRTNSFSVSMTAPRPASGARSARATAGTTIEGSRMADRSTKHAPSAKAACSMSDAATAVASRDLPTPPGPTSVNRRTSGEVNCSHTTPNCSSRPKRCVGCAGMDAVASASRSPTATRAGGSDRRGTAATCSTRNGRIRWCWLGGVQRARWSRQAASVATCPWPGRPKPAADWLAYLLAPFGRDLRGGRNDEHALAVADDFATVGHQAQARLVHRYRPLPPGKAGRPRQGPGCPRLVGARRPRLRSGCTCWRLSGAGGTRRHIS